MFRKHAAFAALSYASHAASEMDMKAYGDRFLRLFESRPDGGRRRLLAADFELGGPNDSSATDLSACWGECDNDDQCAEGLKCFQREGLTPVPGCKGEGKAGWDYCYDPTGSIELSGGNDGNAKNLQACTGECDNDAQCAAGLKCFQRSNGETIPGCTGSGAGDDWDYCYDPNWSPTGYLGGPNDSSATDLPACWGECDNDGQCAEGLKCFQRAGFTPVPGCKGPGKEGWDYCYDPAGSIELSGGNDGNAKNLQACTGECDNDAQCAAGLKCFQRSNGETIPGCTGSGAGGDWDYCYDPNWSPTGYLGGPNDSSATDLPACWGECDNDNQCAEGLKCFQREGLTPVPGCKGEGKAGWDYCYDPTGSIELSGGNDGSAKNLQACTGECDNDAQCSSGLKCFQRSSGETIPGCTGSGAGGDWDYCYDPNWSATECGVGELPLDETMRCSLNGYTCVTRHDGSQCCNGRRKETRVCVPCDETGLKKPAGTVYTDKGNCSHSA